MFSCFVRVLLLLIQAKNSKVKKIEGLYSYCFFPFLYCFSYYYLPIFSPQSSGRWHRAWRYYDPSRRPSQLKLSHFDSVTKCTHNDIRHWYVRFTCVCTVVILNVVVGALNSLKFACFVCYRS